MPTHTITRLSPGKAIQRAALNARDIETAWRIRRSIERGAYVGGDAEKHLAITEMHPDPSRVKKTRADNARLDGKRRQPKDETRVPQFKRARKT